jgi:hypothetical protein
MELNHLLRSHKRIFRKLEYLWPALVNRKNFVIPETIEEYKQFGIVAPRIKIDKVECYFTEQAKSRLEEFTRIIHELPEVNNTISYNSIYHTTILFIEKAVCEQPKHSVTPNAQKDIEAILQSLFEGRHHYQYLFVLEGLELEGIQSLRMGDVEVFAYSDAYEKELQKYREKNNENNLFDENIVPFVNKHFANKICVRTTIFGDEIMAKEIATKKINEVVNVLRFIICVVKCKTIFDNRVKIALRGESYDIVGNSIRINRDDKSISLMWGGGRKPLFSSPLNVKLLSKLNETCFFSDLISMLTKNDKTDLEKRILTSIYWMGEAQNDFVYESAFLKYWTALETIFTPEVQEVISKEKVVTLLARINEKEGTRDKLLFDEIITVLGKIADNKNGVAESLARAIATFLVFRGYKFAELYQVREIYRGAKKLYDKRSKVIHHGLYEVVSPKEIAEVCKYAVATVLTCMWLRTEGYENLEQLRVETNRLYEASIRHTRN